MRLDQIKGSKVKRKRVGRGIGSGRGKTSGRGHKGQKARGSGKVALSFEGGQMPFVQRIPKLRGFRRPTHPLVKALNLKDIAPLAESGQVTLKGLRRKGILQSGELVKILSMGELNQPLIIEAHFFSQNARQKIEKAGGRAITL